MRSPCSPPAPSPDADTVTVFGGDTETAMFAALWLAEQGRQVTLSSPAEEVGLDTNDMQRDRLKQLLEPAGGVTLATNQDAPSDGTVVWARSRTAELSLADAVNEETVRVIGTRLRGGRMYEATQSGFWAASTL